MVYDLSLTSLRWIYTWEMIHDGFSHWRWLTYWLLDLNWVLAWNSSLWCWSPLDSFGDVLHDGHVEMIVYLENALLRRSTASSPRQHGLAWVATMFM